MFTGVPKGKFQQKRLRTSERHIDHENCPKFYQPDAGVCQSGRQIVTPGQCCGTKDRTETITYLR